jgi:hypothetical protein
MTSQLTPAPAGYATVTPWIIVRGAAAFIDYLVAVFEAVENGRVANADGSIAHAEVKIGDSIVMLFDAREDWPDTEYVQATLNAELAHRAPEPPGNRRSRRCRQHSYKRPLNSCPTPSRCR